MAEEETYRVRARAFTKLSEEQQSALDKQATRAWDDAWQAAASTVKGHIAGKAAMRDVYVRAAGDAS